MYGDAGRMMLLHSAPPRVQVSVRYGLFVSA